MTASRSVSAGSAPRSRSAAIWPFTSLVVAATIIRRNASRRSCGQPPDDAEVEQRRASVGQHEQVAAVQVAVEDAVDQRALHEGDHPGADHGLGVDPGVAHPGDVVEAEPGDPLHHEDPAGHELGMGARDHVAVLAEVAQDGGDVEHVGRFHAEVELLDDRLGEQLDEGGRVGQRGDRDATDEVGCEPRHRRAGRGARDGRPTAAAP